MPPKKSAAPASTPATPRKADRPHPYATPTSGLSKNKKSDSTRASQRDQYLERQEWTPPEANLVQPETTLSLPVSDKEMEVLRQFDLDMKDLYPRNEWH
ncbi:hypothetical protein HDU77_002162 [Chytriomyces hyalinus]|nr:hypothetical protein HDU77_002162 [Chytriomyces hyalinus]